MHRLTQSLFAITLLLLPLFSKSQLVSIPPSKDALVEINQVCLNWQTTNAGNYNFAQIMSWTWFANNCGEGDIRTFMEFDIAGLMNAHPKCFPEQSILNLKFVTGSNQTQSGQNDFTIEMVTAAWGEMTITWDNQPPAMPTYAVGVAQSTSATQDYAIDITQLVNAWTCEGYPNYGMRMMLNSENIYRRVTMGTKENTDPNLVPHLDVNMACVDLGPDIDACENNMPVMINGTVQNSQNPSQYSYSWTSIPAGFTSANANISVQPTDTITYILQVSSPTGCDVFDTVRVNFIPVDTIEVDTTICNSQTLSIQGLNINAVGTYYKTYTSSLGCDSIYEIRVTSGSQVALELGNDTLLCNKSSVTLQVDNTLFPQISWSDGSNGNTYVTNLGGKHWVTAIDTSGCAQSDTIMITAMNTPVEMLSDTVVCGLEALLDAGNTGSSYVWNYGLTTQQVIVIDSGIYWVMISNGCGNFTDSLHVKLDPAGQAYVPNVFTPNEDGLNDEFFPEIAGEEMTYRFTIFNRWGNVVYDTTDPAAVWNGKVSNRYVSEGVYVYMLQYMNCHAENERHIGHVTVMR